jgi:hypothetical protein
MGHVATSTARNTHLAEHFLSAFEYGNAHTGMILGTIDGRKKSGSTAAHYNKVKMIRHGIRLKK